MDRRALSEKELLEIANKLFEHNEDESDAVFSSGESDVEEDVVEQIEEDDGDLPRSDDEEVYPQAEPTNYSFDWEYNPNWQPHIYGDFQENFSGCQDANINGK